MLPGETQSDVLFREGQTLGGHVTYTPRLIAMDVKGQSLAVPRLMCLYIKIVHSLVTLYSDAQTGSLRTLREEGSLYDPGKDTSSVTWCVCTHMFVIIHPFIHFGRTTLMLENQQILVSLLDKSMLFLTGREAS